MKVGITIDVPDIDKALAFYGAAFGFVEVARPAPVYAVAKAQTVLLGLMQKPPGSRPTPVDGPVRDYARHWTPIHLDFHVEDLQATLRALLRAGGKIEEEHRGDGDRPSVAFCSDPFGHGFCVLGPRPTGGAA